MELGDTPESTAPKPWQVARAEAIEGILQKRGRRIGRTLDVGLADGYTGARLFERLGMSSYVGYDAALTGAECEALSREAFRITNTLPEAANDFDLVLVRDALEYAADDALLLRDVRARVHSRGRVLVLVPAFEGLFSDYDRQLGRHRRYSLEELCGHLASAGMPVQSSGYLFGSLLLPRVLRRASEVARSLVSRHRAGAPDLPSAARLGGVARRLAASALELENSALLSLNARGVKVPGITAWALSDLYEVR
ncbi:MAG TPA: hypothetical protein VFQ35_11650 [Polyangiaceae bacterium]|nr:hypothetical protein [Polyangiaceae bacterium]